MQEEKKIRSIDKYDEQKSNITCNIWIKSRVSNSWQIRILVNSDPLVARKAISLIRDGSEKGKITPAQAMKAYDTSTWS
jgi:hypothetical protein